MYYGLVLSHRAVVSRDEWEFRPFSNATYNPLLSQINKLPLAIAMQKDCQRFNDSLQRD